MKPDGGNVPIKARILCPYYLRHTDERKTIVCEGLAPGVESAMVFPGRDAMERYSEKYCETFKYGHCPLARAVSLKIELQNEKAGGIKDRIDVNGNYEPSNCRRIPMAEQSKNRRCCK